MKKLILSSLCLVSISVFAQNKKSEVLTYVQGQGTAAFYIPAESDFVEGQELFIKDKSRGNISLTFFKTTKDTVNYYVDINRVGEKSTQEEFEAIFATKGVDPKANFVCTEDHQPSYILLGSGQQIISLTRGNITRTYKLNLELEK